MFDFLIKKYLGEVEFAGEVVLKDIDGINVVFSCKKNIINLYKFIFLCNTIKSLPLSVKEIIVKYGGLIRLDEFKDMNFSENVLAFFRPADKAIFVKCSMSNSKIKSSLYHEIGHLYDVLLSKNKETSYRSIEDVNFHNIAIEEGKYYGEDSYYMSNIVEYFAESFCRFYLAKSFEKHCPCTYTAMLNYLRDFKARKLPLFKCGDELPYFYFYCIFI